MKIEELRLKAIDELHSELLNTRKELFNVRFQKGSGQLQNTMSVSILKKKIARIKTLLTERKKESSTQEFN